jgi:hypothetical protein
MEDDLIGALVAAAGVPFLPLEPRMHRDSAGRSTGAKR